MDDYDYVVDNALLKTDNWQDFDVDCFIENYCNPKCEKRFKVMEGNYIALLHSYPFNDPVGVKNISDYLNSLTYPDFLKTTYWSSIAIHMKYRAGYKCTICANHKRTLNVHHRDYKFKGIEILHLRELVCLCDYCHNKFHDRLIDY